MKRILSCILILLITAGIMAGCNLPGNDDREAEIETDHGEILTEGMPEIPEELSADENIPSLNTMEDVFASSGDFYLAGEYDNSYIYVFDADGTYYRAFIDLPDDIAETVNELDMYDETYNDRIRELISPLGIAKIENLSTGIPSEGELSGLIGKTGGDLLDDGWSIRGYNLDEMMFWMEHGYYVFDVIFDGRLEAADDFNEYEAVRSLPIKSIVFDSISDSAANPE